MRVSNRIRCQCLQEALDPIDALGAGPSGADPGGSPGGERKAAELGLSPAAMSLPTSGNGLLLTDFFLVAFSGPPSEMKEEMNDLKSRVEALEQVSFQHTPLPCPALAAPSWLEATLSQLPPRAVRSQGFPLPRLYF